MIDSKKNKITKNEYKKQIRTFIMTINELKTKEYERYDLHASKEKRTVKLILNHLDVDKEEMIIEESDVNAFRVKLWKLLHAQEQQTKG
jgi:hypothetical protein